MSIYSYNNKKHEIRQIVSDDVTKMRQELIIMPIGR